MNESKKTTRKKEKAGISCFGLNSDVNDTNLTDLSIHVQFAVYLCNSDRLEKFDIWFDNIAKLNPALLEDLMKNEEFCLCIVRLRLFQKKYQDVFQLLKAGPFTPKDDYVKLWEDAHYKQKEETLGQALTPLQRFRIRKKFPPPANICPFGRQIINPLFKQASHTLKNWFQEHSNYPYPNLKEKQMLAKQTGLTLYQVKTWFANTRRRKKVHQMRSSLKYYKLLNKSHLLIDSKQLVKESSEALDLSIQNLETRAGTDLVDVKNEDAAGLQRKGSKKQENEEGQSVSKTSHKCCLYCPEFSKESSMQQDSSAIESAPNDGNETLPNRNQEAESSYEQTSIDMTYSSVYITNTELFKPLMPKQMCKDANLQKNAVDFKHFSLSEEPTKSMTPQESEVSYHVLNKATYPLTPFPSFNATQQQQVIATDSHDAVPISPQGPSSLVTGFTSTVQTLPLCSNPTIYSFPVLTTSMDPPVNFGTLIQDASYFPNNQSSFNSSKLLNQGIQNPKLQENSGTYPQNTEPNSFITYLNSKPSCINEYPMTPATCPATETLAFAVSCPSFSMPSSSHMPPTKPSTSSRNSHLEIIPTIVNRQAVKIKSEDWNQLPRSYDTLPSTSHDVQTLGTSSQIPQDLHNILDRKELMHLENEIAHTLLRLSGKENKNPL